MSRVEILDMHIMGIAVVILLFCAYNILEMHFEDYKAKKQREKEKEKEKEIKEIKKELKND